LRFLNGDWRRLGRPHIINWSNGHQGDRHAGCNLDRLGNNLGRKQDQPQQNAAMQQG
jgi:hypothetical protein